MKIYYDYDRVELLTEQEAKEYTKEDVLNDNYGIWEFITENYSYTEVMDKLSRDFFDDVTEEMVKTRLEDPNYFLVREIPD
jgi:hypothetical protein